MAWLTDASALAVGWLQLSTTGCISLSGQVYKVDGISFKATGAAATGQRHVVLPGANRGEVGGLSAQLRSLMDFRYVEDVTGLLREAVLGKSTSPGLPAA